MPATLEALLIIFFAMSPGFVGERVYNVLVGADWREKDWQRILRLVLFSTIGLGLYVVIGRLFGWHSPVYVFPNSFSSGAINPDTLHLLFLPYFGHCLGATLIGLLAAVSRKMLGRWSLFQSPYPAVWDEFLRSYAPKHGLSLPLRTAMFTQDSSRAPIDQSRLASAILSWRNPRNIPRKRKTTLLWVINTFSCLLQWFR